MSHIFISYSRKDLDFAQKIVDALAANKLDTWIDWKSIPKGEDWEQEIYRGIEGADAFLFLISPDSVASKMCNKEIAHAVANGKRILPIFIANLEDKDIYSVTEKFLHKEQKDEIIRRNFIKCREGKDDFKNAVDEIQTTIHTDYEWLKYHTHLQVKALEWEGTKDSSRLLRGKELREAETLLSFEHEEPRATSLQRLYLLKSRQAEERQRRQIIVGLVIGLIIVAALAIFAWGQRNNAIESEKNAIAEANIRATAQADAEQQARISRTGQLAAQAINQMDLRLDLALLLSVEANRQMDTFQSRNSLYTIWQSNPNLIHFLYGHTTYVSSLAFSPNGKILASCDIGGVIRLWDIEKGESLGVLDDVISCENTLAFRPDGKALATGGNNNTIRLWDVDPNSLTFGQPILGSLSGHTEEISSIAFSPDGEMLASGSQEDGTIWLWDLTTGLSLGKLAGDIVSFSPDGSLLASGNTDGIRLWEISSKREINYFDVTGINCLSFSPSGKFLASGDWAGTIWLWNVFPAITGSSIDEALIGTITGHTRSINSLDFNLDDYSLASGSADGTIRLWHLSGLKEFPSRAQGELTGHVGEVNSIAFSPNGEILASAGNDSIIRVWHIPTSIDFLGNGKLNTGVTGKIAIQEFRGHSQTVSSVAFSPDGATIASGSHDKSIQLWEIATGEVQKQFLGQESRVNSVAFNPDGNILASGSDDATVRLWDVNTGQVLQTFTGHTSSILSIAFSPNGKLLASGSDDDENSIRLWDVESGKLINELIAHTHGVNSLAFSPDGEILASSSKDGHIRLWKTTSGQLAGEMPFEYVLGVASIAFSPDGKFLASGSGDGVVRLWDVDKKLLIKELIGHIGLVSAVIFSPDGKMLASGSSDSTIRLWNVIDQQPIGQPIIAHSVGVTSLAFSPDGQKLASGSFDKIIRIWAVSPEIWQEGACQRVGRNLSQEEWALYFPNEPYRVTCPQWPPGE